ncbi:MAG: hypothetical protein LBE20_01275 [Deltaproteobacteria bacterium]|jgi:hypothetical protein|nr:hypothetical protein [Deltaproteobacteria bacterium]
MEIFNILEFMTINLKQTSLIRLKTQMDKVALFIKASRHNLAAYNEKRYQAALKSYTDAIAVFQTNDCSPAAYREFYKAVLNTQVNIDAIPKPDVDPNLGWVRFIVENYNLPEEELFNIDTQLMTLRFAPFYQGALVGFEYKPRKVNLSVSNFDLGESSFKTYLTNNLEFQTQANSVVSQPTTVSILTHTQDLLYVLFKTELLSAGKITIFKDYKVKSGLGSHLPNTTTGFSMKYWLESKPSQTVLVDKFLVLEMSLFLPTGMPDSLVAQTLMCIGGVDQRLYALANPAQVKSVPGGLYGVRLIDGLDNFVLDLRSAKKLEHILLSPIFNSDQTYCGTKIAFYIEALDIMGIDKSNTIFVSIT